MEQRTLRLGDIVDDYCPRERRVTNHAIVAIVDNTIRQTRCSTCDTEHEYKEAKVPKKKTKGAEGSDLAGGVLVTPKAATNGAATNGAASEVHEPVAAHQPEPPAQVAAASNGADSSQSSTDTSEPESADDPGPVVFTHRPLIRASLPKTDGEPPPQRAIPEFTMYQRQGRGFGGRDRGFRHGHGFHNNGSQGFRGGNGHGPQNNNGNGDEIDGNRAPQPGRPPGAGGGGRRRRRRRR
jgi:hypothetical protein